MFFNFMKSSNINCMKHIIIRSQVFSFDRKKQQHAICPAVKGCRTDSCNLLSVFFFRGLHVFTKIFGHSVHHFFLE